MMKNLENSENFCSVLEFLVAETAAETCLGRLVWLLWQKDFLSNLGKPGSPGTSTALSHRHRQSTSSGISPTPACWAMICYWKSLHDSLRCDVGYFLRLRGAYRPMMIATMHGIENRMIGKSIGLLK
jgi:hypothetical protein